MLRKSLFYLGLALLLTFLSLGVLSIKPVKVKAESLETKAKTLLKLIPEKKTVTKPEPVVEPPVVETPPEAPVEVVAPPEPVYVAPIGTCADWMSGAGITDRENAIWLINKESGCRPNAVNPYSGACGIPQSLPCSKMGCSLQDPVCQLKWMQNYVFSRYGSWANAKAFHLSHGWY